MGKREERFGVDVLSQVELTEMEAISAVAQKHIEFERIHPFKDGNGRTGRVIMNQQLLNYGMIPSVIKNQSKYRQAFSRYDRNGDLSFMEYVIADGIIETCERLQEIHNRFLNSDIGDTSNEQ